jgi:replicative DNA helicase
LNIPWSEDIERGLLVGVLTDPKILIKIQDKVSSRDFYKNFHSEIYAAIETMKIDEIDSLTVEEKLQGEAKEYFKALVSDSDSILPSLSNIIYYAETVRDKARLRAGINLGQEITAQCFQPNADTEEVLSNLEQLFARFIKERVIQSRAETTQEAFQSFLDNLAVVKDDTGTHTGFYDLDLMLHKMEGLTVLAAQTSVGKTAFALNIARNVARDKNVLFFSLEQTEEQLFERLLAAEAEINSEEIRTQAFLADKMGQAILLKASESVQNALGRLFIDDRAHVSTQYISSVARQKFIEMGSLGLIVVDYLHIMKLNDKKNSVEGLGDAVKELRALGKELGCPVLLLSQLRRKQSSDGKESTKRPDLSDLRQSGEIEQSADVVIFLYRSSYFNQSGMIPDKDLVEVIVRKNRSGRTGSIELEWLPKYTKFKNR